MTYNKSGLENSSKKTIALFIDDISDEYEVDLWKGVLEAVDQNDVNLICYNSGAIHFEQENLHGYNILYNFVHKEKLDGLILFTAALTNFCSPEQMQKFCLQYKPLPIVSIGQVIEGIPTIIVDNKKGMFDSVIHLIEKHSYKKIAFVCGPENNPEADDRLDAYKDALIKNGISIDEELILPGTFNPESGEEAVKTLLKAKKEFEAIVCVDDYTAFGAKKELTKNGLSVPTDVAVMGFDDIEEARFISPPLSTVKQPLQEQGKTAVNVLLNLIDGNKVPKEIFLSTELIIRQSCGCFDPLVMHAGKAHENNSPVTENMNQERIKNKMVDVLTHTSIDITSMRTELLLSSFLKEINGQEDHSFLSTLDEILSHVIQEEGDILSWQDALSIMRQEFLNTISDIKLKIMAEDLWQQARVMIGENAERIQAYKRFVAKQQDITVREIGQALITKFELSDLIHTIEEEIPRLNIHVCYLVIYDDKLKPPVNSKLILGYNESGSLKIDENGIVFPSKELLPASVFDSLKNFSVIVVPLFFNENDIGYCIFSVGLKEGVIYDALRVQISTSLEGSLLLQELKKKQKEEMERMQKEMEIAKRIQTALLPMTPDIKDYDISACMFPADDVGGDYYDFFKGDDGRLWFIIGDVSGHGLTSGLIMLMAQSAISTVLISNPKIEIQDLYSNINDHLYENIRNRLLENHFMTLAFISLTDDDKFTAIGSHIDQIIYRSDKNVCELVSTKGLWAGIRTDVTETLTKVEYELNKNDILVLFTDGLIEAMNKNREQFDTKRVLDLIIENHEKDADELKDILLKTIFKFMDKQDDDITLMIIKRR